jgi:predicted DNA-binding WGR domain protein
VSKKLLDKQLVYLDFTKNEFKFYNVEVLSIGYNEVQVILTSGALGNKGRNNVELFTDKNPTKKDKSSVLKEAMKKAYKKIYEKKSEGYISLQKMEEGLKHAIKLDNIAEKEEKNKKNNKKVVMKKTNCDQCKNIIDEKLYTKIDSWARGSGNWDLDPTKECYKKVFCLDCQIEKDIFQRKF